MLLLKFYCSIYQEEIVTGKPTASLHTQKGLHSHLTSVYQTIDKVWIKNIFCEVMITRWQTRKFQVLTPPCKHVNHPLTKITFWKLQKLVKDLQQPSKQPIKKKPHQNDRKFHGVFACPYFTPSPQWCDVIRRKLFNSKFLLTDQKGKCGTWLQHSGLSLGYLRD